MNPAEERAAFECPAVACNRFVCAAGDGGVRLMFGEQFKDNIAVFHAAVMLSERDARELVTAMQSAIDRHWEKKAERKQP